jgi:hypothetical protein
MKTDRTSAFVKNSGKPKEIKAFPIWAVMLLMSIGMCMVALGILAIIYDMSVWYSVILFILAFKAFNTPWIYNKLLNKLRAGE